MVIFRYILDKLIYNEIYDDVDKSMSVSNVGARKQRNIRDNVFIVNGIVNSAIKKETKPLEILIYDVSKCFDSLWLKEIMNDMYESGVTDDKLEILYIENEKSRASVKTPFGLTERFSIENVVMQGTVFGPLKTSVQIDIIFIYLYI